MNLFDGLLRLLRLVRFFIFFKEVGFFNGRRFVIVIEVLGRFWSVGVFVFWSEESGNFIVFVMDGLVLSDRMSVVLFEGLL